MDRRQPKPKTPVQVGPLEALLRSNYKRVQSVVLFLLELGNALRKEFDPLWSKQERSQPELELVQRVDAVLEAAARGREFLARVDVMAAQAALKALLAYDVSGMTVAARGLEAVARQLRAIREIEAAAAASAAPERGLLATVRRWASAPNLQELERAPRAGSKEAAVAAELARVRQTFESAFGFVSDVLRYVGPRLNIAKLALAATGLPGRRRPWDDITGSLLQDGTAAGLSKGHLLWLAHLTRLFYDDTTATQRAHVAVSQWDEAQGLQGDAELLRATLATTSSARQLDLLGRFNVGKFRAAALPLSHLHLTFKGIPHLQDMFPVPGDLPGRAATARA